MQGLNVNNKNIKKDKKNIILKDMDNLRHTTSNMSNSKDIKKDY